MHETVLSMMLRWEAARVRRYVSRSVGGVSTVGTGHVDARVVAPVVSLLGTRSVVGRKSR